MVVAFVLLILVGAITLTPSFSFLASAAYKYKPGLKLKDTIGEALPKEIAGNDKPTNPAKIVKHQLYLRGLPPEIEEADIKNAMSSKLDLKDVKTVAILRNKFDGNCKGGCYVNFQDEQSMNAALAGLQNLTIKGDSVTVEPARSYADRIFSYIPSHNKTIFIGNIDFSVRTGTVKGLCEMIMGTDMVKFRMGLDKVTGQSRGHAFIELMDESLVEPAMEKLKGVRFFNREITVERSTPQNDAGINSANLSKNNRFALHVANLPYDVNRDMMTSMLDNILGQSEFVNVVVPIDLKTTAARGFAMINFDSEEKREKAFKVLSTMQLQGRTLRVSNARTDTSSTVGVNVARRVGGMMYYPPNNVGGNNINWFAPRFPPPRLPQPSYGNSDYNGGYNNGGYSINGGYNSNGGYDRVFMGDHNPYTSYNSGYGRGFNNVNVVNGYSSGNNGVYRVPAAQTSRFNVGGGVGTYNNVNNGFGFGFNAAAAGGGGGRFRGYNNNFNGPNQFNSNRNNHHYHDDNSINGNYQEGFTNNNNNIVDNDENDDNNSSSGTNYESAAAE